MQRRSMYMALALMVLAVVTVWTVQRPKERGMQRLTFAKAMPMRPPVDRIEISGAHRALLQKDDAVWRVKSGRAADGEAIARALQAVARFESTELLTDEEVDHDAYNVVGAKSSDVRLEANGRSLLSFTLSDDPEAAGNSNVRYGARVFKTDGELASTLLRDEAQWIDRHLFDVHEEDVTAVTATVAGEPAYTLRRDEEKQWTLESAPDSPPLRFDPGMAANMVNVLFNTQVHTFIDAPVDGATTGLTDGAGDKLVLTATAGADGSARQATLSLGRAEKGEVFARIEGAGNANGPFTLMQSQVDAMRRRRGDLRAMTVMGPVDFDLVVEAGIERPNEKPLRFLRKGEWTLASAKPYGAFVLDPQKLTQRLRRATLARAMSIAPKQQGALSPGNGRVWLKTKDGTRHEIRFGAKAKAPAGSSEVTGYWAKGSADGLTYKISRPLYDDLLAPADGLTKVAPTAAKAPAAPASTGLEGLPADVRATIERQLAEQGHAG